MTLRLRRSELAVPASKPHMIEKAAASDADLAFLDLEDAVVPALKVPSRDNVVEGLDGRGLGSDTARGAGQLRRHRVGDR